MNQFPPEISRFLVPFFGLLLCSTAVLAAKGGEQGIPAKMIFFQILNLSIALGLLAYFVKAKVRDYFLSRSADFQEMVNKAQSSKIQAEQQYSEIQSRLNRLITSADSDLEKARSEAEALRTRLISEAETIATRTKREAQNLIDLEFEKAQFQLRKELMDKAFEAAENSLSSSVPEMDQKKLQNEFVEKMQAVK